MIIKEIQNKQIWEDFLEQCKQKTFLQSWIWGEFQNKLGRKIWRFGVFNNNKLAGIALIIKIVAKRGTFLLCPHGPLLRNGNPKSEARWTRSGLSEGIHPKQIQNSKFQILNTLLKELKKISRKEKVSFIRISPIWERNLENENIFQKLGFRNAPIHIHPEASWVLDINNSEHELLINMRKTTRYLIGRGLKNKDIGIFQSRNILDIEKFSELHEQTAKRLNFTPFALNYLKNEFSCFNNNNQIILFIGKYKGEIAAMSFVIYWSGIGFYHHAVLSLKYRKIPLAYLLQWEAIKQAKKRNCVLYDFWGYVDPKSNHPWAGPTLFKMGFGGRKVEYIKTQDFILSHKYWFNFLIEKIRKIKRRL